MNQPENDIYKSLKRKNSNTSISDATQIIEDVHEESVYDRASLEALLKQWTKEWSGSNLKPLDSFKDLLAEPKRIARFSQREDLLTRSKMIYDKANREVIEMKTTGVNVSNTMSLKGVEWYKLDHDAEDWMRSKLSGRCLRRDYSIR